ncbi:MAG: LicD family protein [Ruminococcaceae bacterium]|nr:LicD family protein [Oscillospiraceae bacterium]
METLHQEGELATLQEHQQALLCLLREFDRVCKALDIPYFLFAGTLLGAVRHEDFIPWDDDLDVIMRREDYARFLREAPKVLDAERFFLQKEFSEHFPMFFSKLRLNGTTCLEKYHPKDPQMHQGVYMDIFPCDNAYGNGLGRQLQFLCSKVVIAKGLDAEGYDTDSKLKKAVMRACRILPGKPFRRIVRGPKTPKKQVHCFLGAASSYRRSIFSRNFFEKPVELSFANGQYPVPGQYEAVLSTLYGDYMVIPPKEERKCKEHALLVDLTRNYPHYSAYRDGMRFDMTTKSIR